MESDPKRQGEGGWTRAGPEVGERGVDHSWTRNGTGIGEVVRLDLKGPGSRGEQGQTRSSGKELGAQKNNKALGAGTKQAVAGGKRRKKERIQAPDPA
ncbi:hypothetical protein Y1Q_0007418 [Alligator mississippiensis]|uniref:Uncharacterized protein n=1 Tax=Alligator mississippiensis TaxID=8496 RepID=A0A151P7V4_ALLMI|nr:hypothetical protein Y1Q_0007418 [Alligator mississippiensis]